MIAAMKQISLSIDVGELTSNDATKINYNLDYLKIPNFLSQFAFIFDPSTLTFGPLITYFQFRQMSINLKRDLFEHPNVSIVGKLFQIY
jgi:hypothetical protein